LPYRSRVLNNGSRIGENQMRTVVQTMAGEIIRQLAPDLISHWMKQPEIEEEALPEVELQSIHRLPGRLRLRCWNLVGNRAAALSLQDTLGIVQGIVAARVDHRTGSILIQYDPELLDSQLLEAAVERLLQHEDLDSLPAARGSLAGIWDSAKGFFSSLSPQQRTTMLLVGVLGAVLAGNLFGRK